jgi:hypothetical protein
MRAGEVTADDEGNDAAGEGHTETLQFQESLTQQPDSRNALLVHANPPV